MCVSVFVCETEREKEGGGERENVSLPSQKGVRRGVGREREKGERDWRKRERKSWGERERERGREGERERE